jgi:hypothetical protein
VLASLTRTRMVRDMRVLLLHRVAEIRGRHG